MGPSGASGEVPRSGYYPDPSIPGYIRYWNGSSWVPGTSRPEPREGEPMPEPPAGAAAPPAAPAGPALASSPAGPPRRTEPEETGPVFLDEDEGPDEAGGIGALPELRPGGAPGGSSDGPSGGASAWQADAARQAGPDGEHEGRISWPEPEGGGDSGRGGEGRTASDPRGDWGGGESERPEAAERPRAEGGDEPPASGAASAPASAPAAQGPQVPGQGKREHTVGLRRSEVLGNGGPSPTANPSSSPSPSPSPSPSGRRVPGQGGASASAAAPAASAPARTTPTSPTSPTTPAQSPASASAPASAANPAPPWQQQVQELAAPAAASAAPPPSSPTTPATPFPGAGAGAGAGLPAQPQSGGPDAVTPWRPPVEDPFAHALRQARPAGLGRRLGARLVDLVLTLAVGGGVAFPFVAKATDHIDDKIDAVEQAGVTKQVWLIDGTTGGYLAIVLGALLVFGLLYEVLPTARWGKTPGKKLFGVTVLDVERQDPPGFGAALTRWLMYGVLGLLVVGVVNVLWCVFDKPWRQCWHDKVARTFVAGPAR
ncbi:hypothetical protein GCM10009801_56000 [Streptomyces albiaxialis]|uniref:RDD domain-containing protein n=1 Tax=Streptomyces albiaxialis TaxID=329523 RepID=A0ABN2WEQ8_9ACTN